MASQQAFQAYPQNKGTLNPGQTISVNKHTVQVERYLSQGGFAHVYLVRTPTPVYNTTHHVLKRIQVSDESMLTEVRKEVDVMRLLKGHPNIVHLIDAAWHKMPNGMFEVFILMEYCPGGGIIDMMNRRLRERLTEAEILQIFVDVCEGVAYMHNSRPPLLHRDLKVENILQSSPTSFKLCDFGSATNVGNPPTNMQEIRILEADLNRHTTLQYRAPEMVDVYSKRPINEKSDVWALGVLLYKLCYYTTPFEEHGPLAILNVQYRTPSYPLYSQDMNMLIASMLREHGSQRPTVFDLLTHVHRLRGTKSKFSYNIPIPSSLSPRTHPEFKPSPSPNNLVAYTSPSAKSALSLYEPPSRQNHPPINQGIQARDKVLEAIAPMRRGRPGASGEHKRASSSSPPNSQKTSAPKQTNADKSKNWLDNDFGPEQDQIWKAAERNLASSNNSADLGWTVADGQQPRKEKSERSAGFGDNFDRKLWNSSDPNLLGTVPSGLSPRPKTTAKSSVAPIRPLAHTGGVSRTNQSAPPSKDAFEGLGLMTTTSKPAPTMGEARKLRTGLAIVNTPFIPSDYKRYDTSKGNSTTRQPSLSPRPNYLSTTLSHPKSISPTPTPGTSNVSSSPKSSSFPTSGSIPSASRITNGLTIESRFPSLEELDARLVPSVNLLYPSSVIDASRNLSSQSTKSAETQTQFPSRANFIGNSGTGGNFLKPSITPNTSHSVNGVRSEQVTGVAMREPKQSQNPESDYSSSKIIPSDPEYLLLSPPRDGNFSSRPLLAKKHPTSMSTKPGLDESKSVENAELPSYTKVTNLEHPQLPPRPSQSTTPRDWLTGDDDHREIEVPTGSTSSEVPVLRGSPSKRTSYIELDRLGLAARVVPQHAVVHDQPSQEPLSADLSPTVSKFKRAFPALEMIDTQDLHSSDALDLVDTWSSVATKDSDQDSSSADEEPEDPRSLRSTAHKKTPRAKGRQSSVHELVYQYGGVVVQKEKEHERERVVQHSLGDYVPQQPKVRPSGLTLPTKPHKDSKTPSPTTQPLVSPIGRSPQPYQSSSQANKSHSPVKANKPERSRPQSMFIFPSKSIDSSSIPSPGLVPPEESKPRTVRRTSISDIVERYEAIGGKTKLAGPPSPHPKPLTTKITSTPAEPRRVHKPSVTTSSSNVLSSKVSMPSDPSYSSKGDDLSKSHLVSMDLPRQVPRTPTKPRKSVAPEKGELIPTQTVDSSTPRPRRLSRKPEPFEHVAPQSLKAPFEAETSTPTNPPRKLFGTDLSSSKSEDRSPSPERPYQGVGRLIDQWQKKSAEADPQPIFSGKRSGFVPKRVGIAHGDDGRSQ